MKKPRKEQKKVLVIKYNCNRCGIDLSHSEALVYGVSLSLLREIQWLHPDVLFWQRLCAECWKPVNEALRKNYEEELARRKPCCGCDGKGWTYKDAG